MTERGQEYETLVEDVLDLRAFALTADLRSFTAAARLMGESKATVSRRITRLESALGVSLLRRTARVVEPTDDGVAYRARVSEILELLGDANAAVRRAHAAPAGQLRVTAPPGFSGVLPPLFAEFARRYPEVVISVLISERFVDLEAEHVDVALRATTRLADSTLVGVRLLEIERICVAAPAYLEQNGRPRRVEDLERHRMVQLGETRRAAELTFESKQQGDVKAKTLRLQPAISATDVAFAKELTVAGAGVSVLPAMGVQRELDEGTLVRVLPKYSVLGASLFLLHRGGRFLPPKVRVFRDFLVQSLGRAGAATVG